MGEGGCTLLVAAGGWALASQMARHRDEASRELACLCKHVPSSAPRLQQSRPRCLWSDALVLIILCAPLWPVGRQAWNCPGPFYAQRGGCCSLGPQWVGLVGSTRLRRTP